MQGSGLRVYGLGLIGLLAISLVIVEAAPTAALAVYMRPKWSYHA